MKKSISRSLFISTVIFLFFFIFVKPIYANMIDFTLTDLTLGLGFIAAVFFASSSVEFFISYLFLKKNLKNKINLYKCLLMINLVTWPLTQIVFINLYNQHVELYGFLDSKISLGIKMLIAELLPIIAEFFLLRWQFKDRRVNPLKESITNKMIFLIDLTMNLASFALGIPLLFI